MPQKIGELARRCKVSVRTLHHYDKIGLVSPSLRNELGHRLYSEADIGRLQKVILLKSIAFSLDEIARFLDDAELSALKILEIHSSSIRQELLAREKLLHQLDAITERLKNSSRASMDELVDILEGTALLQQQFDDPDYIKNIQKAVLEKWVSTEVKGRTLVAFKISESGSLGELKVLESSGDAAYDQNCLKAIREAAENFDRPPFDNGSVPSGVEMHFAFGKAKKCDS